MKFVVSKTAIEKVVKDICRVISTKNALPILGDILCEVKDDVNVLHLVGSDSEIWLQSEIALMEAEGSGKFCVDANRLKDALSQLTEQPITIIADTENGTDAHFELQHESGKVYSPVEDANEYPTVPDATDTILVSMQAKKVAAAINTVITAVAQDDLRPIMNGVCFNFTKQYADVVGSDGHVIMRYREDENHLAYGSFIMPRKVASMLPKMLDWVDADDTADIMWNDMHGVIEQNEWSLTFRLIEGRYPNYESVIPSDNHLWCQVERSNLISSIKKVAPFTNDSSEMLNLSFKDTDLTIHGENCDLSVGAEDRIGIESNIDDLFCIGMKASSILKVLSRMSYLNVKMSMKDAIRAVVIEGVDNDIDGNILGLVMPMMLND